VIKMGKTGRLKWRFPSFSWIFLVSLLCGLVGFLEGSIKGAISSVAYSIINSFLGWLGLIPFAGIPLYLHFSGSLAQLLTSLSSTPTPVAFAISFFIYLILAGFVNILVSIIAILLILVGLKEVLS